MRRVIAIINDVEKQVELLKKSAKNSRIKEDDAPNSRKIPSSQIRWETLVKSNRPIIPITPLRCLYHALRKSNPNETHPLLFDLLCPRPEGRADRGVILIRRLFEESVKTFAKYDNRSEHFVDDDRKDDRADVFAKNLIPLFKKAQYTILPQPDDLRFAFVGYEVSTLTTTQSKFDDGCPSKKSGQGGMDFLFSSFDGGLPVVGEVKAATETVGPFFALVQAMMYASELVTEPQWARLVHCFPEQFGGLRTQARSRQVDLYLIFEKTEEGTAESEMEQVERFARQLLEDAASCLAASVRRVVAFETRIENGQAVMDRVFRVG